MFYKIAILGAGTMGDGIARFFARQKLAVAVYDIDRDRISAARYDLARAESGVDNPAPIDYYLTYTSDLADAVAQADFIIESAPEDLSIKRQLYADLAPLMKEGAILSSNTSTFPLAVLRLHQPFANRMLITHFFNPPDIIPLVEIVRHENTEPGLAERVADFLRQCGKVPVVLKKDIKGFVANRLQVAVLREACYLVENGIAGVEEIDTVMTESLGIRWAINGPFRIADLGGLDVWQKVCENLLPELSREDVTLELLNEKMKTKSMGLKSGQGFYPYNDGGGRAQDFKRKLAGLLKLKRAIFLFIWLIAAGGVLAQQPVAKGRPAPGVSVVEVDAGRTDGMIRRLQGGNLGPVSPLRILNLSDYFRECKIPVVRLHDAVWFTAYAVDITTIFRDFRADASKEESYDFRQTDEYIDSIEATGADIIYRLGESIEWTKQRYNVNPPADFAKWAAICCHIIRHYNEGWARGFHYKIKYWEIWNEPDNGGATWTGTRQQFFDLYKITASAIRKQFPDVEVGGPAIAIPLIRKEEKKNEGKATDGVNDEGKDEAKNGEKDEGKNEGKNKRMDKGKDEAKDGKRGEAKDKGENKGKDKGKDEAKNGKKDGEYVPSDFTEQFLDFCSRDSVPLDFFSWHNYGTDPWELAHLPTTIRHLLDRHHFLRTKSFLDEWNYIPPGFSWAQGETREKSFADQSSVKGGAFLADVLMLLQDEPIDIAAYYTTTAGMYGLFSDFGVPHKSAYAFKAFSALVNNTPVRLEANYNKKDSLVICAGTNEERTRIAVLISNFTGKSKKADLRLGNNFLSGPVKCEVYAVDEKNSLAKVGGYTLQGKKTLRISVDCKGPSVVLVQLSK